MTNGNYSTCNSFFFDSGGGTIGSGYSNNETFTYTFCPNNSQYLRVDFYAWDLGSGDVLTVYNGNSTTAPILGVYDATNVPGLLSANPNTNSSGCLTFQFISDSTNTGQGWGANVSCFYPCQDYYLVIDSLSHDTLGGVIQLCQDDSLQVWVHGIYPNNGTYYTQNDVLTSFNWFVNDTLDSLINTSIFSNNFNPEGGYRLEITGRDTVGCPPQNPFNFVVEVSTNPNFSNVAILADTFCFGDTVEVIVDVSSTPWSNTDSSFIAGVLALPDAPSSSLPGVYSSSLNFSMFNSGDTVTSVTDILDVWIDIEHSYLGDLTISISCPNGSTSILKSFPGGLNRWLGEICYTTGIPGIGYTYTWPNAITPILGTMNAQAVNCVGCPSVISNCNAVVNGISMQSSTYAPVTSMSNLIGCPLNGNWSLTIVDQWMADDGTLFGWGINFDSNLFPSTVINYDPGIDSVTVLLDSTSYDTVFMVGDTLNLVPNIDDTSYATVISVVDGFGCSYDTTINFFVRDMCDPSCYTPVSPTFTDTKVSCPNGSDGELYASPNVAQMPMPWTFIWTDALGQVLQTTLNSTQADTIIGLPQGVYDLEIIDGNGCSSTWQTYLGTINAMQVTVVGVGQTSCASATCDASASTVVFFGTSPYSYLWSSGDTTPVASTLCAGLNNVFITDANGCVDTSTFNVTTPAPIVTASYGDTLICVSNTTIVGTNTIGGTPPYVYDWNSGFNTSQTVVVNPGTTQTYTVLVTDANNCTPDTGVVVVSVRPPLSITFASPDTLCPGDVVSLLSIAHGGDSAYSYVWEQGLGNTAGVQTVVSSSQFYQITVTDGCGTTPVADSVWLQVGGYPPLKVGVSPDDTICVGDVAYLFAKGIGGDHKYHYVWDNNLGTGSAKGVKPLGFTTYSVTVTDECFTPPGVGSINISVGDFEQFDALVDTIQNCDPGKFVFGFDTLNSNFKYQINFGDGYREVDVFEPIERTFTEDGCHDIKVKLTSEYGCVTEKKYPCFFTILPTPIAKFDFNPHKPNVKEFSVDFWDESIGAKNWTWFSNNSLISQDEAFTKMFPDSGLYNIKLIVSNEYNCTDTTNTDLSLQFVSSYYIPTAFTPNGDNNNDVFNLVGEGIQTRDFEMIIYDRWGGEILNITSRDEGWNGKSQNTGEMLLTGTYSYSITFRLQNGRKVTEFGNVNLLR